MLLRTLVLSVGGLLTSAAMADDGLCKPMAAIAKMSAEQRDKGVSQEALLRTLVRESKLDPKDASGPFVINTVVWVYEENISAKSAYEKMYKKCRLAVAKNR